MPVKRTIERYNRCMWMIILSAVLLVGALALVIPGSINLGTGDSSLDFLLYFGLILMALSGMMALLWYMCQLEIETLEDPESQLKIRKTMSFKRSHNISHMDSPSPCESNGTSTFSCSDSGSSGIGPLEMVDETSQRLTNFTSSRDDRDSS